MQIPHPSSSTLPPPPEAFTGTSAVAAAAAAAAAEEYLNTPADDLLATGCTGLGLKGGEEANQCRGSKDKQE